MVNLDILMNVLKRVECYTRMPFIFYINMQSMWLTTKLSAKWRIYLVSGNVSKTSR